MRLDRACAELLKAFCAWLLTPDGGSRQPEEAGSLAHAADRYLRDFAVDIAETGPADAPAALPRRYLANWYIVHTLQPTHAEIDIIREALLRLQDYLAAQGLVGAEQAAAARESLADEAYFHRRLEEFWDLSPEGVLPWRSVDDYRLGGAQRGT